MGKVTNTSKLFLKEQYWKTRTSLSCTCTQLDENYSGPSPGYDIHQPGEDRNMKLSSFVGGGRDYTVGYHSRIITDEFLCALPPSFLKNLCRAIFVAMRGRLWGLTRVMCTWDLHPSPVLMILNQFKLTDSGLAWMSNRMQELLQSHVCVFMNFSDSCPCRTDFWDSRCLLDQDVCLVNKTKALVGVSWSHCILAFLLSIISHPLFYHFQDWVECFTSLSQTCAQLFFNIRS